ncbi:glycerol-3-phosphate acyltransferase [Romeria aff. gracilis LEGE 07310]|uniref:Glycerol-3-phosphate acyltransferase n=1 Tax=Vasconcelosia minhoensis LEGE 07310 TaxID=915328 RepID=A0A8J7ASV7_9CYAN|nr:glycerol-3-phosphate acyltransferase [Romeria gracilis]MBE9075738.1 glycerol-3-phosphate acyltransferase [Romeria aff. gracilis LEGE 07310]
MAQVYGALLIFIFCPILGGLPLSGWIVRGLTGKRLAQIGTGNVGVSAAFYHGGTAVGVISVVAEALKGIGAVAIAQYFFGADPVWPILALIALVMGRYWMGRGAGATNVTWGFIFYDPVIAGLTLLISLVSFTLFRLRHQGRLVPLILLPILTGLRYGDGSRVLAVACLSGLLAWIYQQLSDDLDLPEQAGESRRMFQFFRGGRALQPLSQKLRPEKVGTKAATLSQLTAWGYPVPPGYVLPAGDDPTLLVELINPLPSQPVVARSSAVGEDLLTASAAGQYLSILDLTSGEELEAAIAACFNAYNRPAARRYRRDRGLPEGGMSVLVQRQVPGVFSGVAFSRDPVAQAGNAVVIEALPGAATQVVSGQVTPERYRVSIDDRLIDPDQSWLPPAEQTPAIQGHGQVPANLLQQVAFLARHLEARYHGLPQDVEWSFDGEQLWVLQSRPITNLSPIWTRKIAAEVIPGVIPPLTWSINRPLTCGVWGQLFTLVLKQRAAGIDFEQTASLRYSRAYFNATLLGDLFRRMGLPPESLDFLTRGAGFSRPPLTATLRNLPGLLRLARQEWRLPQDFARADQQQFGPALARIEAAGETSPQDWLQRVETILALLEQATYFNILAPLGLALRQALLKVDASELSSRSNPEVQSMTELSAIATQLRPLLSRLDSPPEPSSAWATLSEQPEAQPVFEQVDRFLDRYGYLSEVATDISVPTWREAPHQVRALLVQMASGPDAEATVSADASSHSSSDTSAQPVAARWKVRQVQTRLDLKGRVAEVYNRLLAALRACFIELEQGWLRQGKFQAEGDIFFLTRAEVQSLVTQPDWPAAQAEIAQRRAGRDRDAALAQVPYLVYGDSSGPHPPTPDESLAALPSSSLKGIGASPGLVEGTIRILTRLDMTAEVDRQTVLVVPYTDAGWVPLLARAGGLIAEVGGQLSHGAIVAREYGIPAVMDVTAATQSLTDGQRVRLDGWHGTIEIL